MADEVDDPRYVRAWRSYRWRVVLFISAFLGVPAVLGGGAAVYRQLTGSSTADGLWIVVGWLWLPLFLVSSLRLSLWRCPRCNRSFFCKLPDGKNPFARRCMHCGLAKWSRSSGPDLPAIGARTPAVPAHVQGEVRFLTTAEGGRESPVASGYRGQLSYDGRDWDAVYGFPGDALIGPGAATVASLWLVSPDAHRGKLVPGKSFEIREGRKVVARGVVTNVLALGELDHR